WEDHAGKQRRVSVAVLRRILAALGLPCDSADDLRHSQETVRSTAGKTASPVITSTLAPHQCVTVNDIAPDARIWGLATQLYGLRRAGEGGIGDTTALTALAHPAARHGADAVAISPAHAGFAADPGRYRPYSPSSRLFLNPLHADPRLLFREAPVARTIEALGLAAAFARLEAAPLIDWPAAGPAN